ncbi:MAG TPA: hypothetical protein PK971_15410, partial [Saprospiraceae bacterium]|nr:hypothetical protein [Saprospiraceae bacterium]
WYKWYSGYLPAGSREGPDDYMHADIHQICRTPGAPDKIYYATDGGIFVSYDGGKTFAGRNGGYQTQQFYANLGSSSLSPQLCIGGMQDNSTAIYSGDLSWKRVLGGDGECAAIMPGNDQVMFGSSQYLNMYRSDDGGESFLSISPPEAFDEDAAFNGPFEISPADPKALYAGAGSLFFSDDQGNTWSNMSAGPVSPGHVILTIAPHPTNKYAAYFSTAPLTEGGQAQVYRFDFWNSVLEPLSGLPERLCMDLAISTSDTNLIYAVFGGFGTPHVYRSRDAGNTWTAASEGLPDVPTNSIQIDPGNPDYLYVGNDLGVWQSRNAGQNWEYYSAGAPQAMLAMHLNVTPSRVLRVATYGLGVWQTQLPPVTSVQEGQGPVTGLRISPNPAQEVLQASFEIRQTQRVVLDILDLSGRVLITQPAGLLSAGAQQVRVPVGHLPAGCYGLRLRAGGTHTGQVWVKK